MDVRAVDKQMLPVVAGGRREVGITFTVRQVNGAYRHPDAVEERAHRRRPRWGKDYADPSTFIDPLFNTILPSGNTNYSLVGLTPAVAKKLKITGEHHQRAEHRGRGQEVRQHRRRRAAACYAAIDRKLTTQIVPWVPYLWRDQVNILAPNVTKWTFDQNAGLSGFGHVAVSS